MRYEPKHKAQTRDRIVRNAARKLRAEGLSGPGVASVMKASGLTVGGFYEHGAWKLVAKTWQSVQNWSASLKTR